MTPAVTPVLIPATSSPDSTRFPTYRWHIGKWDPADEVAHSDHSCSLLIEGSGVIIARSNSKEGAGKHSNRVGIGREGGEILSFFLLSAFLSSALHFATLSTISEHLKQTRVVNAMLSSFNNNYLFFWVKKEQNNNNNNKKEFENVVTALVLLWVARTP